MKEVDSKVKRLSEKYKDKLEKTDVRVPSLYARVCLTRFSRL